MLGDAGVAPNLAFDKHVVSKVIRYCFRADNLVPMTGCAVLILVRTSEAVRAICGVKVCSGSALISAPLGVRVQLGSRRALFDAKTCLGPPEPSFVAIVVAEVGIGLEESRAMGLPAGVVGILDLPAEGALRTLIAFVSAKVAVVDSLSTKLALVDAQVSVPEVVVLADFAFDSVLQIINGP